MPHGMLWLGTGMMPLNIKAATRNDINFLGFYERVYRGATREPYPYNKHRG